MKRRARESIVRKTTRLMTITASDIAESSEETVLEANGPESDETEGVKTSSDSDSDKSDSLKLDNTINICKNAGIGYVLLHKIRVILNYL